VNAWVISCYLIVVNDPLPGLAGVHRCRAEFPAGLVSNFRLLNDFLLPLREGFLKSVATKAQKHEISQNFLPSRQMKSTKFSPGGEAGCEGRPAS
jgi:hypothetical protein